MVFRKHNKKISVVCLGVCSREWEGEEGEGV